MQLELSNGLDNFWQWDTNQSIIVPDGVPRIDFKLNEQTAISAYASGNTIRIPDECFQSGDDLILWAYNIDHTTYAACIHVEKRVKPTDYVYTPTETEMWHEMSDRLSEIEGNISNLETWKTQAETAAAEAKAAAASLSSASWTPVVSGAESYDYQVGTYAVMGDLAIVTFAISGTFSSSADGDIVISGCPAHPAAKSSGGGYLTGYFSADNLVFSGWAISSANYNITPVTQWATTSGTKYIGTAKQSAGVAFEASGTIAFRIA